MIVYYRVQIKEEEENCWINDPTYSPLAVQQDEAHSLIEMLELNDNERLIMIDKSEAMENNLGEIFWIKIFPDRWRGVQLTVNVEELSLLIFNNIESIPFYKINKNTQ